MTEFAQALDLHHALVLYLCRQGVEPFHHRNSACSVSIEYDPRPRQYWRPSLPTHVLIFATMLHVLDGCDRDGRLLGQAEAGQVPRVASLDAGCLSKASVEALATLCCEPLMPPDRRTLTGWIQVVVATYSLLAYLSNWSSASAGVFHSSVFRGLALRAAATAAICSALCTLRSVPFGKYWHSNPLVFSLVPRCQGL